MATVVAPCARWPSFLDRGGAGGRERDEDGGGDGDGATRRATLERLRAARAILRRARDARADELRALREEEAGDDAAAAVAAAAAAATTSARRRSGRRASSRATTSSGARIERRDLRVDVAPASSERETPPPPPPPSEGRRDDDDDDDDDDADADADALATDADALATDAAAAAAPETLASDADADADVAGPPLVAASASVEPPESYAPLASSQMPGAYSLSDAAELAAAVAIAAEEDDDSGGGGGGSAEEATTTTTTTTTTRVKETPARARFPSPPRFESGSGDAPPPPPPSGAAWGLDASGTVGWGDIESEPPTGGDWRRRSGERGTVRGWGATPAKPPATSPRRRHVGDTSDEYAMRAVLRARHDGATALAAVVTASSRPRRTTAAAAAAAAFATRRGDDDDATDVTTWRVSVGGGGDDDDATTTTTTFVGSARLPRHVGACLMTWRRRGADAATTRGWTISPLAPLATSPSGAWVAAPGENAGVIFVRVAGGSDRAPPRGGGGLSCDFRVTALALSPPLASSSNGGGRGRKRRRGDVAAAADDDDGRAADAPALRVLVAAGEGGRAHAWLLPDDGWGDDGGGGGSRNGVTLATPSLRRERPKCVAPDALCFARGGRELVGVFDGTLWARWRLLDDAGGATTTTTTTTTTTLTPRLLSVDYHLTHRLRALHVVETVSNDDDDDESNGYDACVTTAMTLASRRDDDDDGGAASSVPRASFACDLRDGRGWVVGGDVANDEWRVSDVDDDVEECPPYVALAGAGTCVVAADVSGSVHAWDAFTGKRLGRGRIEKELKIVGGGERGEEEGESARGRGGVGALAACAFGDGALVAGAMNGACAVFRVRRGSGAAPAPANPKFDAFEPSPS